MLKICKWCNQMKSVNSSGYCKLCNAQIRENIIAIKNKIAELEKTANPDMAPIEKQLVMDELCDLRNELNTYKVRKVPFFKSDPNEICNGIFAKLGLDYCFPVAAYNKKARLSIVLGFAASCLIIVLVVLANANLNNKHEKLLVWVEASKNLNIIQSEYITQLEDEIATLQKPVPTSRSYTLQNGNFVSGKNFTPGTYNITAISGGGNVYSDNLLDGGINAIMGVENDGHHEKQYKNINLPEGTIITIDGVKVRLTLVE